MVPTDDLATLLDGIRAAGPRAPVLVAGHRNTASALLNALGCAPSVGIAEIEYDNLLAVLGGGAQPVLIGLGC